MAIGDEPKIEGKEKIKLRVLAADDEPGNRNLLRRMLDPRYTEVVIVEDGEALIRELLASGADCILSDNTMPIKKGIQVLQEIRKMKGFQNMPFILFTTDQSGSLKAETESLGGVFLAKPAQKQDIYSTIENAVEAKK